MAFTISKDIIKELHKLLEDVATGGDYEDPLGRYTDIRVSLLKSTDKIQELTPDFIKGNRRLSDFWVFIKEQCGTYQQRRQYIGNALTPLYDYFELQNDHDEFDDAFKLGSEILNNNSIQALWDKCIERCECDPEGAVTAARSLIETVCKSIIRIENPGNDVSKDDLPQLLKKVQEIMDLSPSKYTRQEFKQILSGVTSVICGMAPLRNKLSDAHGSTPGKIRPKPRHSRLCVNLAGSISMFLIETWQHRSYKQGIRS